MEAQTATFSVGGGGAPSYKATSEQWNGTAWTEVGDLNVAVYGNRRSAGTTTSMISYGGIKSPAVVVTNTNRTMEWNVLDRE